MRATRLGKLRRPRRIRVPRNHVGDQAHDFASARTPVSVGHPPKTRAFRGRGCLPARRLESFYFRQTTRPSTYLSPSLFLLFPASSPRDASPLGTAFYTLSPRRYTPGHIQPHNQTQPGRTGRCLAGRPPARRHTHSAHSPAPDLRFALSPSYFGSERRGRFLYFGRRVDKGADAARGRGAAAVVVEVWCVARKHLT